MSIIDNREHQEPSRLTRITTYYRKFTGLGSKSVMVVNTNDWNANTYIENKQGSVDTHIIDYLTDDEIADRDKLAQEQRDKLYRQRMMSVSNRPPIYVTRG